VVKHGSLRASDADRDQIIDRLRKAAAEGRLAAHELETRVTTALRAQTYAELDATVSDLPATRRVTSPSAVGWAASTVRAHPALLLLAVPVAAVVAATLIALTTIWALVMLTMFALGHRGHVYRGPWSYATRRGSGPPPTGRYGPSGHYGPNGRFAAPNRSSRHRGYSA
jgi:hypothetical protein